MPAVRASKAPKTNLLLTIPDRGGATKEQWMEWIKANFAAAAERPGCSSNLRYFSGVREPYAKPMAGMTHHFHFGLAWDRKVLFNKFFQKCVNPVDHPLGATGGDISFHNVAPRRGLPAQTIFRKYFTCPSKFKRLDENLSLVCDLPPRPRTPTAAVGSHEWAEQCIAGFLAHHRWSNGTHPTQQN